MSILITKRKTNVNRGRTLVTCEFGARAGLALPQIIDPLGRVYEVTSFTLPQQPGRIARFALSIISTMSHNGMLNEDTFANKERLFRFHDLLKDAVNFVNQQQHTNNQPAPHVDDGLWVLYDPATVKKTGELLPITTVYQRVKGLPYSGFQWEQPQLPAGHRLVAVIIVAPINEEPWTVAFDASSKAGYRQLSTIQPCSHYAIRLYSVKASKLKPLRTVPPPFV